MFLYYGGLDMDEEITTEEVVQQFGKSIQSYLNGCRNGKIQLERYF